MAHFSKYVNSWQFPLHQFFGYLFSIFLPAVFNAKESTKPPPENLHFLVLTHIRPRPTALSPELRLNIRNLPHIFTQIAHKLYKNIHISTKIAYYDFKFYRLARTNAAQIRSSIPPSPPKKHLKNPRFHRINPQNTIQSRPPITPSQPAAPMNAPTSHLKSHNPRALSPANNPIGVSLLAGQVLEQSDNPASGHRFIDNPIGLVSQNSPTHICNKP